MGDIDEILVQEDRPVNEPSITAIAAFLLLAAAGLEYVKWSPSLHRLQLIASGGSMSQSALIGSADASSVSLRAAWTYAWSYGRDIWKALVVGLLLGSGVQAVIPLDWVARLLGAKGYRGVSTATLIAMPSMMCTCCAAPVAVGLRRTGASIRATLAYWLANPMLNPATLVLIGMILGWKWLALRSILGIVLIVACTFVAARWTELDASPASGSPVREGSVASESSSQRSAWRRWLAGFFRLAASLIPEYLVLILFLGASRAWLFPHQMQGQRAIAGFWSMLMLVAAGTLFAIPTAAEIPIIQTMMAAGLGAAPAAALLVTLPTISLPSLAMMTKALPTKVLIGVGIIVAATGMLAAGVVRMLPF